LIFYVLEDEFSFLSLQIFSQRHFQKEYFLFNNPPLEFFCHVIFPRHLFSWRDHPSFVEIPRFPPLSALEDIFAVLLYLLCHVTSFGTSPAPFFERSPHLSP